MKKIFQTILISLVLAASYGFAQADRSEENILEEPAAPEVIHLEAARAYNPSSFHYDGGHVTFGGKYEINEFIDVIEGNSGVGWASLIVGDRKYCYQGNADDRESMNGGLFELVAQKESVSSPCHDSKNLPSIDMEVELEPGDLVELRVEGGGCSVAAGTCELTFAVTELYLIL